MEAFRSGVENAAIIIQPIMRPIRLKLMMKENHGTCGGPNRIGQGIEFDNCCVLPPLPFAMPVLNPLW
jgi:hypothetical protein